MKTYKIVVYVPLSSSDKLQAAMAKAGAGVIGNYTGCSFSSIGKGRFLPGEKARPTIGSIGQPETVEEERIEMNCDANSITKVINAVKAAHPYEEVAYDIYERIDL